MPDRIIREIALIGRYSRHNEAEDRKFAAYIKGYVKLSEDAIDTAVRDETERVWSQIDCTTCGNCCRTLQVFVDDRDIGRLSARLGMTTKAFLRKHTTADPYDKKRYLKSRPCAFLDGDNRCTVYDDRPQACRDFPYLHDAGFRRRTLATLDNLGTCPIVFNVWQALKQRLWHGRRRDRAAGK